MDLRQSTASQTIMIGPFLDSTDGDTEEPGFTILNTDIQIWKFGATSNVNKNSGGATFASVGMYYIVLDATDTSVLGGLKVLVHFAGSLYVFENFNVCTAEYYDTKYGTDHFTVDLSAQALLDVNAECDTALADYDGPTRAELTSDTDSVLAEVADQGMDGLLANHTIVGSEGEKIGGIGTASDLADATWDELKVGHVIAGSFGEEVQSHSKTTSTDAIKAVTDIIPDSGAMTSIAQDSTVSKEATLVARTLIASGYFDPANDTVDIDRILGTLITETNSGDVARSLSFFYDVSPTTTKTVNDVGVAGTGLTAQQVWEYVTRTLTAGTKDSEIDAIKAITDNLPDSGVLTSIAQDSTVAKEATKFDPASDTIAEVTLVTTTTTNTDMVGTDGANTTVPDVAGTAATLHSITDGKVDAIPTTAMRGTDIGDLNNISPAEVNAEVVDALNVDVYPEPGQGVPLATTSLAAKINYIYKSWRNRKTQTATTTLLYADDGITADQKSTVSDDLTTAVIGEMESGA